MEVEVNRKRIKEQTFQAEGTICAQETDYRSSSWVYLERGHMRRGSGTGTRWGEGQKTMGLRCSRGKFELGCHTRGDS